MKRAEDLQSQGGNSDESSRLMKDPVSYELSVFPLEFLSTLHAELAVLVRCSRVRLLAIHSHGQCGRTAHAPPSNREGSKASECTDSPAHVVASLAVWHFRGTSVCLHPNSAQSALPPTRMRALVASVRYRQVQQQRAGRDEAVKYSLSATKHRNDVSRRSSFTAQGHSLMRASV